MEWEEIQTEWGSAHLISASRSVMIQCGLRGRTRHACAECQPWDCHIFFPFPPASLSLYVSLYNQLSSIKDHPLLLFSRFSQTSDWTPRVSSETNHTRLDHIIHSTPIHWILQSFLIHVVCVFVSSLAVITWVGFFIDCLWRFPSAKSSQYFNTIFFSFFFIVID